MSPLQSLKTDVFINWQKCVPATGNVLLAWEIFAVIQFPTIHNEGVSE
jgi:hypothetical protein